MALVLVNGGSKRILDFLVANDLTLRLYSNNKTPAISDIAADYDNVSGGGYAQITLTQNNWTVSAGNPSIALYNFFVEFFFTGITNAPFTIYGYYVLDSLGNLMWAERFPVVPFTPQDGSLISVRPRFTERNQ